MTNEQVVFFQNLCKEQGIPKIVSIIEVFGTSDISHFTLEWNKPPYIAFVFITDEKYASKEYPLPILSYQEAINRIAAGTFPL